MTQIKRKDNKFESLIGNPDLIQIPDLQENVPALEIQNEFFANNFASKSIPFSSFEKLLSSSEFRDKDLLFVYNQMLQLDQEVSLPDYSNPNDYVLYYSGALTNSKIYHAKRLIDTDMGFPFMALSEKLRKDFRLVVQKDKSLSVDCLKYCFKQFNDCYQKNTSKNSMNIQLRIFIQAIAFSLPTQFLDQLKDFMQSITQSFQYEMLNSNALLMNNCLWLAAQGRISVERSKEKREIAESELNQLLSNFIDKFLSKAVQNLCLDNRDLKVFPKEVKALSYLYNFRLLRDFSVQSQQVLQNVAKSLTNALVGACYLSTNSSYCKDIMLQLDDIFLPLQLNVQHFFLLQDQYSRIQFDQFPSLMKLLDVQNLPRVDELNEVQTRFFARPSFIFLGEFNRQCGNKVQKLDKKIQKSERSEKSHKETQAQQRTNQVVDSVTIKTIQPMTFTQLLFRILIGIAVILSLQTIRMNRRGAEVSIINDLFSFGSKIREALKTGFNAFVQKNGQKFLTKQNNHNDY